MNTEAPTLKYSQEYYLKNKERLNQKRIANYHKQFNHIPTELVYIYRENKSIYNLIIKHRETLNLGFINYLLKDQKEIIDQMVAEIENI